MSNTFSTPSAATALNIAREFWNNSHETLLSNFYGTARPTSSDITLTGTSTSPPDGTLWRDSTKGVLKIKDTANNKGGAGNFTVNGVGSVIIESLSNYNSSTFELGELFKTVGANSRLYMKSSNVGSFVDVGIPPTNGSISTAMIGNGQITGQKVSSNVAVLDDERTFTSAQKFDVNDQVNYITAAVQIASSNSNTAISFDTFGDRGMISHSNATSTFSFTDGLNNPIVVRAKKFEQYSEQTGLFGASLPPGIVVPYAGASAPTGWLICNGAEISRTTYSDLFDNIGTNHGSGDGSTTFNIPDLRNKAVAGVGNMTLGSSSSASVDSSGRTTSGSDGSHSHSHPKTTVAASAKDSSTKSVVSDVGSVGNHTHTITNPVTALNYIIKY